MFRLFRRRAPSTVSTEEIELQASDAADSAAPIAELPSTFPTTKPALSETFFADRDAAEEPYSSLSAAQRNRADCLCDFMYVVTLQLATMILLAVAVSVGVSRCLKTRSVVRRSDADFWSLTVGVFALCLLSFFFILFDAGPWISFLSERWLGRSVVFIVIGGMVLTEQWYDEVLAVMFVVGGGLFMICEFIMPRPRPIMCCLCQQAKERIGVSPSF